MKTICCVARTTRRELAIDRLSAVAAILAVTVSGCGRNGPTSPTAPPPSGIDGTYTLRIESTCPEVPLELRNRTYSASIAGSPNVVVTLTGADFWTAPDGVLNRFTGRVAGNSISFNMFWPPETERWGIVERIDSTTYLEIIGRGSGSIGASTIEGRFSAGIGYGTDLRDDLQHVGCSAGLHVLTFRFDRSTPPLRSDRALR